MKNQPTKEAWQDLYEVAKSIKELQPWEYLYDMDIITIKLPEREKPLFCSVMGANGECYAIGVFPGYAELSGLRKMSNWKDVPLSILMNYQNCLMCNYGDRDEMLEEDMNVLKDINLRFRGNNNWIYFRSHKSGYCQWFIDAEECELLTKALQNFAMAFVALGKGLKVDFENGETLMREYSEERCKWINYAMPMPEIPVQWNEITIGNELLVKQLKQAKATANELECELCYVYAPIQENKKQRPYLPKMFMLANVNTQMLIKNEMLSLGQDENQLVLDMLAEYINEYGRPKTIYVRDKQMYGIVMNLCKKIGINLVEKHNLSTVDDFIDSITEMTGNI